MRPNAMRFITGRALNHSQLASKSLIKHYYNIYTHYFISQSANLINQVLYQNNGRHSYPHLAGCGRSC